MTICFVWLCTLLAERLKPFRLVLYLSTSVLIAIIFGLSHPSGTACRWPFSSDVSRGTRSLWQTFCLIQNALIHLRPPPRDGSSGRGSVHSRKDRAVSLFATTRSTPRLWCSISGSRQWRSSNYVMKTLARFPVS